MAATTTPSTPSLIEQLQRDYPAYQFISASQFSWKPNTATIEYSLAEFDDGLLLHEVGHALLEHGGYQRDVTLLRLERDAWTKAVELSKDYQVDIDPDRVDDHLDTYRDWLHARSTCPNCRSNGVQISASNYHCPVCKSTWHVNEARRCGLKRNIIK